MAIGFLPKVQECCGDIPLECAVFAILFWDLIRVGLSTWEFVVPICQNYSRAEGFGLFMRIISGIIMALTILRVVCLVIVILGLFLENLDATIAVNIYVISTFILIVLTITYYSLYFLLLAKAKDKCESDYIEEVSRKVPTPEQILTKDPKKMKSHNWAPPVFLTFFIIESILLVYFAIVVNSMPVSSESDND